MDIRCRFGEFRGGRFKLMGAVGPYKPRQEPRGKENGVWIGA